MREIKFKAWEKKRKLMSKSFSIFQLGSEGRLGKFYFPKKDSPIPYNCHEDYFDWKKELMFLEYTGLHDKNGKEIYEGDIVTYLNCYTKKMLNKQIVWDKYSCGFTCDPMGHQNLWYLQEYLKDNKLYLEVIGNIFQNKELLNDNKKTKKD